MGGGPETKTDREVEGGWREATGRAIAGSELQGYGRPPGVRRPCSGRPRGQAGRRRHRQARGDVIPGQEGDDKHHLGHLPAPAGPAPAAAGRGGERGRQAWELTLN